MDTNLFMKDNYMRRKKMGIFWGCLCTIIGCCSYSIVLGYDLNKYTFIVAAIAGALVGLDFKLSEIKNAIKVLK